MCKREKYEIKVTDTKIFAVYLPPQQERWSWRKWTLWTHLRPPGWAVEKDIPSELCLVFTCSCYEKPLCLLQCLKTHSFSITTQFYFYCKDKSTQQKDKLVTWTQIKVQINVFSHQIFPEATASGQIRRWLWEFVSSLLRGRISLKCKCSYCCQFLRLAVQVGQVLQMCLFLI